MSNESAAESWWAMLLLPYLFIGLLFIGQRFTADVGIATFAVGVVVVAASIGSGIALLIARRGRIRARVLALLAGFVSIIVTYAAIYQHLYNVNARAFQFNVALDGARADEAFNEAYTVVRDLNRRLAILAHLEANSIAAARAVRDGKTVYIDPGLTMTYKVVTPAFGPASVFFWVVQDGERVDFTSSNPLDPLMPAVGRLTSGKDAVSFGEAIQPLIARYEAERRSALARLDASARARMKWEYIDFVYFSAVTMTTLGYGDVVSSGRVTRILVATQALLGAAYFAFALAFLWPETRAAQVQVRSATLDD